MKRKPTAADYGRRAAGVPKRFSPQEIEARKQRLAAARAKRWPHTRKANP